MDVNGFEDCRRVDDDVICHYSVKFDTGDVLAIETVCPFGTSSNCTCSVSYNGSQCRPCSFCDNPDDIAFDCSNVATESSCPAIDCTGMCFGGTEPPFEVEFTGAAGKVVAVFGIVVLFICIVACICSSRRAVAIVAHSELPPEHENTRDPRERQKIIDACLVTKSQHNLNMSTIGDQFDSPEKLEEGFALDKENDQASICDPCQICLEMLEDDVVTSNVSNCGHFFHRDCISQWLKRHDDCPCCRIKFLSFDTAENLQSDS